MWIHLLCMLRWLNLIKFKDLYLSEKAYLECGLSFTRDLLVSGVAMVIKDRGCE